MLKEFKDFLLRGNLVALAVAVVIGVAFNDVIQAFVRDIITPLIAAIGGNPDFSDLTFEINNSTFRYGDFLNFVITFIIIAAVIFFLVVRPVQKLMDRRKGEVADDEKKCPECLGAIPIDATRCAFCTTKVA